MEKMRASHWQYTPNNSPQPLPKSPFVSTDIDLLPLEFNLTDGGEIQIDELKQKISQASVGDSTLGELLQLAAHHSSRLRRSDLSEHGHGSHSFPGVL